MTPIENNNDATELEEEEQIEDNYIEEKTSNILLI
jgi:hypothetical protein